MDDFLKSLNKLPVSRSLPKEIPEEAGIYMFWSEGSPIYIGKAKNLKNRVSSYFNLRLAPKTYQMVSASDNFSFLKVNSELESLLLEAQLIRTFQPKFNSVAKDDKHPLYIKITAENLPRIITARKVEANEDKKATIYGPFPSSTNVRGVLRMLRRIFPFSDHKPTKRVCIEHHLGLCSPCPSQIESEKDEYIKADLIKRYKYNVHMVKLILGRRINKVGKELEKKMQDYSEREEFEKAKEVKEKLEKLNYITQPITPNQDFLENPQLFEDIRNKETRNLQKLLSSNLQVGNLSRIECFDVAHLAGASPTASMVTFIDGVAEKAFYRHFKIYQKKSTSDVDSMKEIVSRRIKHLKDWGEPDLVIVDGGKTQSKVFFEAMEKLQIPVVGLAKRFETLVIPTRTNGKISYTEIRVPEGPSLTLVQRIRNEAHRFARRLHHKLISKSLLQR